jgi:hypothetical protein
VLITFGLHRPRRRPGSNARAWAAARPPLGAARSKPYSRRAKSPRPITHSMPLDMALVKHGFRLGQVSSVTQGTRLPRRSAHE